MICLLYVCSTKALEKSWSFFLQDWHAHVKIFSNSSEQIFLYFNLTCNGIFLCQGWFSSLRFLDFYRKKNFQKKQKSSDHFVDEFFFQKIFLVVPLKISKIFTHATCKKKLKISKFQKLFQRSIVFQTKFCQKDLKISLILLRSKILLNHS